MDAQAEPTRFSKILVPTDFSKTAELAIEHALALRQKFGGAVTLLHAYEPPYWEESWVTQELIDALDQAARRDLAKAKAEAERVAKLLGCADPSTVIDAKVERGDPARVILGAALDGGFDLVVMGTHGRSGFSRLWIGSVAERVVRSAPCPVLTIRGKA